MSFWGQVGLTDKTSYTARVALLKWLQDSYTGTTLKNDWEIKNILALNINTGYPSQEVINYAWNYVNNVLWWNVIEWWTVEWVTWTFNLSTTYVWSWSTVTITNNCSLSPTSYTSSNTSVATLSWNTITTFSSWSTNITPVWCNAIKLSLNGIF